MISTKNVEEQKPMVSQYIKPGIGEYKIVGVKLYSSPTGTQGITLQIESAPMAELDGKPQTGEFTMYMSERAQKYTLSQIADIGKACGTPKEEMDKLSAPDVASYIGMITPIITGKTLRWKFRGEEILSQTNGNKWRKATLPSFKFVESLSVPNTLVFDEDKDIKKLPMADLEGGDLGAPSTEMPF